MKPPGSQHSTTGLIMGAGAILLWSFSATCVVFAGRTLGTWQFLAIAAPFASVTQFISYRLIGHNWRSLTHLPPKLLFATAIGFVIYTSVYNTGLVTAQSDAQAVGVGLMNHMWPALTVLLSLVIVPGERFTPLLGLSVIISVAAISLANGRDMLHTTDKLPVTPYLLGGMAGVCWAIYCTLMARWRNWVHHYATSPIGFLMTGAVAACIALWRSEWQPLTPPMIGVIIFTALGPWGGGYMLWELALHRAPISTLSLMGAATPILSTIWLLIAFAATSAAPVTREQVFTLTAAAAMISLAVILGRINLMQKNIERHK